MRGARFVNGRLGLYVGGNLAHVQRKSLKMAAQAVEYFVLLTVAGTQAEDEENYIVLFSWAVISKSRNQVGIISIQPPTPCSVWGVFLYQSL